MPAPSPYTPPHPILPPQQQTPRLSYAQRLSTPSPTRRLSTPTPASEPLSFHTPVSSRRKRFSSVTSAQRQLIPSASSPTPSTSWADQDSPSSSRTVHNSPSTSSAGQVPTSTEQSDPDLDEDLRDPEFFINLFSRIDGPLLYSDTELREKLERYLLKVNLYQDNTASMPGTSKDKKAGPSNVNFAEAALVVQGSTRIYGKKVDLLFNAAVQLFRLLSTPFEDQEEEAEDEASPTDTPKVTKSSKRLRLGIENRDLAEDIALVDGMKEGGRIEQKKSSRPRFSELIKNLSNMPPCGSVRFLPPNIPRLVRKTRTLGTNDNEVEKINSRRVPQYGQGMEARGFIDEYRLNEVIRKPDGMLVEHFVPFEIESSKPAGGEGHTQTGKAPQPNHCDSGIDSCPSSVYNPIESSDSVLWEGSSIGVYGETDGLSCGDDGFISEGIHEEGISELEEESELEVNKEVKSEAAAMEASRRDTAETDMGMIEAERSGTESSGVFSEHGPIDEPQTTSLTEDERESESQPESERVPEHSEGEREPEPHPEAERESTPLPEDERESTPLPEDERESTPLPEDERESTPLPEAERESTPLPEAERESTPLPQAERESTPQTQATKERQSLRSINKECDSFKSTKNSTPAKSELKEVEFTPTPRRNKRKLKNFKLPCKLSLLLPEKKKRMTKGGGAAELWRPSQSPCSSTSSNYPQSPISFAPASPDPHSLSQLMLHDEDHHEDLDNLSESDNEGEYFDPPADGQPQINYWIQNHQRDLMCAGEPTTLSDQVAQWQELIMPRLEANLHFGPYSHLRYAPVLMELIARSGWPPPESVYSCMVDGEDDCVELSDSEDEFVLDRTPTEIVSSSSLDDAMCSYRIPYDTDFVDTLDTDLRLMGDQFYGFQTPKRLKRRGFALMEGTLNREASGGHLFTSLSKAYNWGLREGEAEIVDRERRMRSWISEKRDWLQSKVKASGLQRNWDEWAEENDNIETNTDLDVHLPSSIASSSQSTEPVLFTTLFSAFRKEEVSRLLFTALHLTSQGVVEISSEPGVINSMKLSFLTDER